MHKNTKKQQDSNLKTSRHTVGGQPIPLSLKKNPALHKKPTKNITHLLMFTAPLVAFKPLRNQNSAEINKTPPGDKYFRSNCTYTQGPVTPNPAPYSWITQPNQLVTDEFPTRNETATTSAHHSPQNGDTNK